METALGGLEAWVLVPEKGGRSVKQYDPHFLSLGDLWEFPQWYNIRVRTRAQVFQPRTLSSITVKSFHHPSQEHILSYLGPIFFPLYSGYSFYQWFSLLIYWSASIYWLPTKHVRMMGKVTVSEIKTGLSNLQLVCPQLLKNATFLPTYPFLPRFSSLSLNSIEPLSPVFLLSP